LWQNRREKEFKSCGKIKEKRSLRVVAKLKLTRDFLIISKEKKWQNNLFICCFVREPDATKTACGVLKQFQ
jgi:hypothetical protein